MPCLFPVKSLSNKCLDQPQRNILSFFCLIGRHETLKSAELNSTSIPKKHDVLQWGRFNTYCLAVIMPRRYQKVYEPFRKLGPCDIYELRLVSSGIMTHCRAK